MTDFFFPLSLFTPLVFLFRWLFLFLKCKENTIKGVLFLHVFCLWFERCLSHHSSFRGKLSASGKQGAGSPPPGPHSLPDLFLPLPLQAASSPSSCLHYASFFLFVLISLFPPQLPPKLNPQTWMRARTHSNEVLFPPFLPWLTSSLAVSPYFCPWRRAGPEKALAAL